MAPLITRLVALPLAGRLVRFAPLIAGSVPDNLDAVSVEILASATVPVKLLASNEPLNDVAVTIPLNLAPPSS